MALKNVVPVFQVFSSSLGNQTMSGTNTITSSVTNVVHKDNLCYELVWSGTPNGTFSVQGSVDYNPGLPQSEPDGAQSNGTWTSLPVLDTSGNPPVASGSAGQILCDLNQLPYPFIRIQYTNSSGSGTLSGWVSGKAIGV